MNYSVFDVETDGLLEASPGKPMATKIHCMSIIQYYNGITTKFTLTEYDEMTSFLDKEETLVGHNIIRFDLPILEKFLGIKIASRIIDTLPLSWYLYPRRENHKLEDWGVDVGVEKPPIEDWSNLSLEQYVHRCEEDTKITDIVFHMQMEKLKELYDGDVGRSLRLIGYLTFKLQCAREQEEVKWKLDVPKCTSNLEKLIIDKEKKIAILREVMPPVIEYKDCVRPKNPFKKDGSPSVLGQRWFDLLKEHSLPEYHIGTIQIPIGEEPGNPGSHAQLKKWLFSLGWVPTTFKYAKDKEGSQRAIPQIQADDKDGLCESVKLLFEAEPNLEQLDSFFIIKHRIGLLEGFLEKRNEHDFLKAEINGLTNTLRFQHVKPIVNLPTIPKLYWKEVRGCLIAPDDNHVLCGSDMSGLEDNTKRHYMYFYDPDYVKEMMEYGFDAHCDIAALSGKMSRDEEAFYKWYDKRKEGKDFERIATEYLAKNLATEYRQKGSITSMTFEQLVALPDKEQVKQIKLLKPIRLKSKKVNFAAVYLAGPPKISLTGNMPLPEAKDLHTIYWKRNRAVKKIANNCITKTLTDGSTWLFNPVSQFWYSLRNDKDRFSTLNQGTGVYCFDSWIRNVRRQDVRICGQFHDEHIAPVLKGKEEEHRTKLQLAIKETNSELKLNVELGISIDFGHSYADIH